ncbi:hypothetical protein SKAU_G00306470 [Synaphobranchus kaupii]|uniref:Uncharacterized protein n=1 Tax=Synaphobranchus kaupii TaxID=118154 RepID=A0A9Q1IKL6_SYNKA|nr:hypothetical protein SKAU_G00306470 [Synaphobranchus kaupii]
MRCADQWRAQISESESSWSGLLARRSSAACRLSRAPDVWHFAWLVRPRVVPCEGGLRRFWLPAPSARAKRPGDRWPARLGYGVHTIDLRVRNAWTDRRGRCLGRPALTQGSSEALEHFNKPMRELSR